MAPALASRDMTIFETERLMLRLWTDDPADLRRIDDIYSRPEVIRWLGAPRSPAPEVVARWRALFENNPLLGAWAIQVRDTGQVAGTVLYKPLPNDPDRIEVGWHLHPDSWGHGYATEAARGTIERGFAGGIPQVWAVVRPENEKSLAVCRRLGLTSVGRTNRYYDLELELLHLPGPTPA
jgi:RimJ/RimL family protein N-acetyltransferase